MGYYVVPFIICLERGGGYGDPSMRAVGFVSLYTWFSWKLWKCSRCSERHHTPFVSQHYCGENSRYLDAYFNG